jgi:hypothetical protein
LNTEHKETDGYVDIIDGQQRLLTITILMSVIRDIAKELDEKEADTIQRHDIAIELWNGQFAFRIRPAETLEDYFTKYIQDNTNNILESEPGSQEEKKVKANYQFLKEKILGEIARFQTKDKQIGNLNDLRKKIRELLVIEIEISKEEDAYDIFETTNARGMELSVSDLLKNLVFKNIKAGPHRDLAKENWKDIVKNVEDTGTELKRFIRYFWVSKYGFVQEKKLFKEIKRVIAPSQWQSLLKDLKDDSYLYNKLLEGVDTDFQGFGGHGYEIYESVFAIRLMGVSQCYVLLLSILRNFPKLGFDPYRIFQFIEKFTFQYSVVCKLPGNRVEKIYSKYALEIERTAKNGPNRRITGRLNSIFARLETELKSEAPSKVLFLESFPDLYYKDSTEGRRLIKYILGKINITYEGNNEHLINFNAVNTEHILPLTPDKAWGVTKKDIKDYVNNLGNLTLLSEEINSDVENFIISKKLPEYEKSNLGITQKLVQTLKALNNKWDEAEINARQLEFAEMAYETIWKIK